MTDKDLTARTGTELAASLETIWRDTEWLNAQVPAGLRKAIGAIQSIENPVEREKQFQAFVLGQLMDVRSAMTRDESKFGHLVAGAESIVKTLQNLNPLDRRLERIEQAIEGLKELVDSFLPRAQEPIAAESRHVEEERFDDLGYKTEPIEPDIEDKQAEEARRRTIGSAWAK
jgi:hypothetical protein